MPDDKKPTEPTAELQGGPAAPPEPTPTPKVVTVKYGGRDLQVPEDVANAWQEREREFDQRLSKQGDELGQLRTRWKQIESQVQPRQPDPNEVLSTKWFEAPTEAAKMLEERVYQRVANEYQQREAQKSFWDGFYRKNDDLREDEFIVEAVLSKNSDELLNLTVPKAQERLAELTRQELLRLTRKVKVSDDQSRSRVVSEPASGTRVPKPQVDEDEGPKSIGDVIRARAAARRQPRTATRT